MIFPPCEDALHVEEVLSDVTRIFWYDVINTRVGDPDDVARKHLDSVTGFCVDIVFLLFLQLVVFSVGFGFFSPSVSSNVFFPPLFNLSPIM